VRLPWPLFLDGAKDLIPMVDPKSLVAHRLLFQLGRTYEAEHRYKDANGFYGLAGDYTAAQFALGVNYAFGDGVEKDGMMAVSLIKPAADRGVADAQRLLGDLYSGNNDAPMSRDIDTAIYYYNLAIAQGNAYAMNNLAQLYYQGPRCADQ
jgi:TPR repeat protein